ncbi:cytochrome c oxidase subunit 4 [Saccharomonospora sp.]|uniref:cytochrome c oxidase subunit 4 n=1 Tax=Saccharomonospora sp. TaxID=33913 RepID=UPI00261EB945|nr:cytochrome c oxidase subunit 4 [Saccharomonospora sp.]
MKVEARVFDIVAIFGIVIAIIYAVMTAMMTQDGVEPVGTVALLLSGGLALLVGSYFRFVARRIEPRPEDHEDAEVSDGAGELGFFSPGSYWPAAVAAGCALVSVALAFFQVWLIILSGVVLVMMIGGLVFEYHTGSRRH